MLPTLAMAQRAQLLQPGSPHDVQKACALVVWVRALARKGWREQEVITRRRANALQAEPPPLGNAPASHVTLERALETVPCPKCAPRRHPASSHHCARCSVRAHLRHTEDRIVLMYETYVPKHVRAVAAMFAFESALEMVTGSVRNPPPELLRCHDLKPQKQGGAYRASRTTRRRTFHGYDFGDTIEQAMAALERFFLGFADAKYDIRAYAWPFLWARYRGAAAAVGASEIAVFADRHGKLHSFVAD